MTKEPDSFPTSSTPIQASGLNLPLAMSMATAKLTLGLETRKGFLSLAA
jgi:hypothetical protein